MLKNVNETKHVKKKQEDQNSKENNPAFLKEGEKISLQSINEQLEAFADILIDHYLKSCHEKE